MPRPQNESYELSEAEKRDLIALIQAGKPLPEKYRFLLFEDKREVELVWNGKSREVCNVILPFQTLEHIDEPRREKKQDEELALDMGGRQVKGWTNKLIWGDNKLILSSLRSGPLRQQIEEAGGLKLIYIDPPFDVGADFSMDIDIGGETFHKEPNLLEQIAYRDTWGRGTDSFISMIYERLILMRDLLAIDGSIYVHCDWRLTAFMRLAMDDIFGGRNFINEIIWQGAIGDTSGKNKKFIKSHDTILFYRKRADQLIWNDIFQDYSESAASIYKYEDEIGRFQLGPCDNPGGGGYVYSLGRGEKTPSAGYRMPKETAEEWIKKGILVVEAGKVPLRKWYMNKQGVRCRDVWTDIGNERKTIYPTQKPEALLERVIKSSSRENELVADLFSGSGTTVAVAEKLGRKWIAADLGKFGIHTTRKRLIGVQRELKADGKPFRPFEVLNLGRYERQAYLNISGNLNKKQKADALARKEREFRDLILKAYKAQPLEGESFFHGKSAARLVVVGPINLPVGRLFVEEVITECRKRGASRVDILAFEFEMGLFPAALDEAKAKGIDVAPKTIPPEVFDKRAVDKGQVRFHDVSFIEATPRFDKKDKLKLSIELTDFSVYYSQGLAKAVEAELKEGKSEVVCDQGTLFKINKDKNGVVTREKLTKHWTDWVDYWAVDFNYESRKEIIKVAKQMGVENALPGVVIAGQELLDFEERWTGAYIFENQWQSFRTRKDRNLELKTAVHTYNKPGRYVVAVKVIDIFGNDTMTLVSVSVG